jgi:hypothetical protein
MEPFRSAFMETTMKSEFKKRVTWPGIFRACVLASSLFLIPGSALLCPLVYAQVITGTLSGTVQDNSGAVVPDATVVLRDALSGATRTVSSNRAGTFTFAGVNSGDYNITITASNFKTFTESGIHLDPGDSRTLPSLLLTPGGVSESVTVSADNNNVPLDSGERSDLITADDIKHLSVEGRDVTELFKILPGFAIANQGVSNSAYDPSQVSVNGALGNYSANGNPVSGVYLLLDGADITDAGNYGAALQNVNYDQVSEVKVEVSNFGAEVANGPVVVSAVTKAGGDRFHGELYAFGRAPQLDAADALGKATSQPKSPDHEVYPGFTIGGPVLIPGTNFNHKRKLTFFAGAEDYVQRSIYAYGSAAGALVHALVPTQNMRNGNFSSTELQNYLGPELYGNSAYQNISTVPTYAKDGTSIANGQIPSSYADPGFAAIFNSMPLPNNTPTLANPYNWQATNFINNDLWEATGRGDIAMSEKNHLFGRYTVERGASGVPGTPYYNQGELNTPGGGLSTVNSESAAANLTTILSPTATNQLFGSLAYLDAAFTTANPAALTAYPYQGAYANGRHPLPQLGNYDDQSGLPRQLTPDYSLSPIFSKKFTPQGGDNFTKVWGTHTAIFGVFVERLIANGRITGAATNGSLSEYGFPVAGAAITDVDGSTAISSGNYVANNYQGYVGGYSQQNFLAADNLYFWNNAFFATDSWHIKHRFTVNYGLRVHHLGLWNDSYNKGVALFDPSLISSGSATTPFPGFIWHAYDSSLPLSGNKSEPFFVEPRFGAAWDIHGNGTTVLRGGWGEYRAHDSQGAAGNAVQNSQFINSVNESGNGGLSLKAVSNLNINNTAAPANTNTIGLTSTPNVFYGLTKGDREQPLTDTYSVTLNQQLPLKMNLLLGYVGNNSRFLLNDGSNQTISLDNVNAIPIGGLYRPNPNRASPCYGQVLTPTGINPSGATCATTSSSASTAQVNSYRPLNTSFVQYGAIDVPNHVLFANYNGLQTGLSHQSGHFLFNVNYTWSHALGIRGADNAGNPADPFHVWNNYGPEEFDRRQIFNASYTVIVGNPVHNKLVGAFTNGWEVSGITTIQTGPDIPTTTTNPGFALSGNIGQQNLPNGTPNPNYIAISNSVYLGTPDVSLQPTLVCNPAQGLGSHQFINGNCFRTPNLLQNGPYRYPFLPGPTYKDNDLSAQKSFKVGKEQAIQFRIAAFNFLNSPLTTFSGDFTNQYMLNATNANGTAFNQGVADPALGFGVAPYKTGRRILELSARYTF